MQSNPTDASAVPIQPPGNVNLVDLARVLDHLHELGILTVEPAADQGSVEEAFGGIELCEHVLWDGSEEYLCTSCGVNAELLRMLGGTAYLDHCGHALSGDLLDGLEVHMQAAPVGDERDGKGPAFWTCEQEMPGWNDD